jgi:hypothetical protein
MPPEKVARAVVDAVGVDLDPVSQSAACARIVAVVARADGHQAFADVPTRRDAHAQPVAGCWWTKAQSVRESGGVRVRTS